MVDSSFFVETLTSLRARYKVILSTIFTDAE
jgi:hypothetical protein